MTNEHARKAKKIIRKEVDAWLKLLTVDARACISENDIRALVDNQLWAAQKVSDHLDSWGTG